MPPVIIREKCVKCGLCAQVCCMDVFGPSQPGTIPHIRWPEECWHCRACAMDCPAEAIDIRYPLPMMILSKEAPKREERKQDGA